VPYFFVPALVETSTIEVSNLQRREATKGRATPDVLKEPQPKKDTLRVTYLMRTPFAMLLRNNKGSSQQQQAAVCSIVNECC
jgi:hypothetical protein